MTSSSRRLPKPHAVLLTATFFSALALLPGCGLETREQQEEKQVMQKQVQSLQRMTADVSHRFADVDEELRKINGRIEVVESTVARVDQKADRGSAATEAKVKELQDKLAAMRDALTKLEQGLTETQSQLASVQEAQKKASGTHGNAAAATGAAAAHGKQPTAFAAAEELFDKKDWKAAIIEYERFRKQSPAGKLWREATYKIGVCFQELGLADDARAFYDELLAKSAGTAEAKKAQLRLKAMKKK